MKALPKEGIGKILIPRDQLDPVTWSWTLPAIARRERGLSEARISILVKPWVADLLRISPDGR